MRATMFVLATLTMFAGYVSATVGAPLPNANLTPGVANSNVTQDNIQETICVSGWTDTIRPPSSYTTALKKKQIGQYHYKDKKLSSYEEDHLISLQLGAGIRRIHTICGRSNITSHAGPELKT